MLHTPLHRFLGEPPGPITDQMIDEAVAQCIAENDELDWKSSLPEQRKFRESNIVKDIAALANAGGGMIVFGIEENNKAASRRVDAGELTENYERTIQQVCMAAIAPPVFGVQVIAIPSPTATRAVALVVPASADGPHLVYRNDYFGAPMRTGADTHWMKERQIEAAYRSRFDAARHGEEALQRILSDMAAALATDDCAVLVGAARPRALRPRPGPREDVSCLGNRASLVTRWWLTGSAQSYHPLEDVDLYGHRPTHSGHHFPPANPGDRREAHAAVFDDGSVGLSWRAGGHKHQKTGKAYAPHEIATRAIEGFAAALVALVHAVAADVASGDYEIVIGVELAGRSGQLPEFHETDAAPPHGVHRTLSGRFRPVRATVNPSVNDTEFIQAATNVATACLNQVGLKKPSVLASSPPRRPSDWSW